VACQPDDIRVYIDGVQTRCGRVDGLDRTVWLQQTVVLHQTGDRRERPTTLVNDATVIEVEYAKLLNSVSIAIEGVRTFYSVVPVLTGGVELHTPGAPGTEIQDTFQVDRMDYMQTEMIRRQKWLLEQRAEPTWLMIRRTKGEPCFCMQASGEPRTGCDACYQTGIIGGYYGPIDFLFVDPDSGATVESEEGGKKVTRESQAFTVPAPMIQSGDMIVRRNGERWIIGPVTYKTHRGVLLQQDYSAAVMMHNDVRYKIPLVHQTGDVFQPAFDAPQHDKEPLSDPRKDPTKNWENPTVPIGRTVTFGNIMT
jgi:virulence-associated protein VagC